MVIDICFHHKVSVIISKYMCYCFFFQRGNKIRLTISFALNGNYVSARLNTDIPHKVAGWRKAVAQSDEDGYTIRSCELCFREEEMVRGIVCFMICRRKALGI